MEKIVSRDSFEKMVEIQSKTTGLPKSVVRRSAEFVAEMEGIQIEEGESILSMDKIERCRVIAMEHTLIKTLQEKGL